MTNDIKNKIVDRVIVFIGNPPELNYSRMAAAYIEELKLIKNVVSTALITPDNYNGLEEWYMKVFECPKCKTKNPINGTKFCRGCGITVKMSKTVTDYDKSSN